MDDDEGKRYIQKKPDVSPLVMCPTEYNRSWASDKEDGYLRTLGRLLNKSIFVMWTGNSVVHLIDKPTMEWVNPRIDRKAYIWWNYPVTDYVRDHLMLGPVYGNGQDIAGDLSGFVSNPMEHAEASKIALYGIADYTWNMADFDAQRDWEKSLRDLLPGAADALRTFALYNEDPGPNGHGFRREESPAIAAIDSALKAGGDNGQVVLDLLTRCSELKTAADVLLADRENPLLIRELKPWLLQARNVADYGTAVCMMALAASRPTDASPLMTFDSFYRQARSVQEQMYQLENSDVRHALQPGIKVGTRVMLPTLNGLFARTVDRYNAANGTQYGNVAEYQPYKLSSTVPQLARQPISASGNEVKVAPSNEVISWPAGAQLFIESEQPVTLQGMSFDMGVAGMAKNFRLEVMVGGEWKAVSLLMIMFLVTSVVSICGPIGFISLGVPNLSRTVCRSTDIRIHYLISSAMGIALLLVTYLVTEYVNFGIYLPISATMAIIALPLTALLFVRQHKDAEDQPSR